MPPAKFHSIKGFGKNKISRKMQLIAARQKKNVNKVALVFDECAPEKKITASNKKLNLFKSNENKVVPIENVNNWQLVELTHFSNILKNLSCPECGDFLLKFKNVSDNHYGFSVNIQLICTGKCKQIIDQQYTSPKKENTKAYEINKRMVLLGTEIGQGYAALEKMSSVLNLPCMNHTTYHNISKEIFEATKAASNQVLDQSRSLVRAAYIDLDPALGPNDIINISVSFDGSWPTRGHTSLQGVGAVIDILTGLCVDYEFLNTYCHTCSIYSAHLDKDSEEYRIWKMEHEPHCEINFVGSSGAMEPEAASRIWSRSLTYKIRYTNFISDGDAKAFTRVLDEKPYGNIVITKSECINHVSKRMNTALRKLSKEEKLGGRGKGRLTANIIDKLGRYYVKAIRNNIGNSKNMETSIWATYFHCISTDEDPHHKHCPPGKESWCFFQRAKALNIQPGTHTDKIKTPLNRDVAEAMEKVYKRLSEPSLLKRMEQGATQNNNESLHSILWNFRMKNRFAGRARTEAAIANGIAQFNMGEQHLLATAKELNLLISPSSVKIMKKRDKRRIDQSERKEAEIAKIVRKARQTAKKIVMAELELQEGPQYAAGAF